jgi:hypothetical protein
MAPPFHDRWEDLTLDTVREFLNAAMFEALTWEAKGGVAPRPESVRKAVCGFANAGGGTLILGAECGGDPPVWRLDGMTFRDEPPVWLSSVIADGVSPVPQFDTQSWSTSAGRHVALVAIEPVTTPPCMTSDGAVFERVSGRTVPIVDPAVLAGLFARGEAARRRALELARESATILFRTPPIGTSRQVVFSFALAPMGLPADFKRGMFRESFARTLDRALTQGEQQMAPAGFDGTREYLESRVATFQSGWGLRVYATGAAVVVYGHEHVEQGTPSSATVIPRLSRGWGIAADVLSSLGAHGPAMAALCVEARNIQPEGVTASPRPTALILRRTELRPTESDLASIRRELEREAGHLSWEPEPEPPSAQT